MVESNLRYSEQTSCACFSVFQVMDSVLGFTLNTLDNKD